MATPVRQERYSQVVAALKFGLPLAAMALLLAVFLVSREDKLEAGLAFSQADLDALSSGLRISNPQFSGSNTSGDLYNFSAASVVPRDLTMNIAEVEALEGSITYPDGEKLAFTAKNASINLKKRLLVLNEGIAISTSEGYAAMAGRVEMDLNLGVLIGEGNVVATGAIGRISAGSLQINSVTRSGLSDNSTIVFSGGVKLNYIPNQENKR